MAVAVAEQMIVRVYTYGKDLYLDGYALQALGAGNRVKGDLAQLYRVTNEELDSIIKRAESRDTIYYSKQFKPVSREYLNKNAYLEKSNKFSDSIGLEEETPSNKIQHNKTSNRENSLYFGKDHKGNIHVIYIEPYSMTYDKLTHSMGNREYTVTENGEVYHYRSYLCKLPQSEFEKFWRNSMNQGALSRNTLFNDENQRHL